MQRIGELGEQFVARWLESRGWRVLYRRWRCCWGEIDLIVQSPTPEVLVFLEVKTRSQGNWDGGGIFAVNRQKQGKLQGSAWLFLAEHPEFAQFPCRFDVALVYCRRLRNAPGEYQFRLQEYLEAAFEGENGG